MQKKNSQHLQHNLTSIPEKYGKYVGKMSPIVAVIGASRGIGKELVRQLAQSGDIQVIASTRSSQTESASPNVNSITLEITDDASVKAAAETVPELDTLIINAAIGNDDALVDTSSEDLARYMNTNVIGTHRVIKAFLPALLARTTRKIIVISSTSGSNELQRGSRIGFQGPYSVSKAGLNMLAVQYHNELQNQSFTVVPIHPGWVATDMGNIAGSGGMKVEDSVKGILQVVANLKVEDGAKFFKYDGTILPW
ncbi:NAD(P)-binding protein [Cadophora sp. DSE1049]|nr:NAD(P)-binding protein [Cadophora sp. DSE1049]